MPKFKICLIFSDTGGGHRSAVDAIETAMKEIVAAEPRDCQIDVRIENIAEKTHPINRGFVDFYNFLLRNNQAAMRYYYWLIEKFQPNNSEIGYQISRQKLIEFFDQENPDVVVSVHPMCNRYLTECSKRRGARRRQNLSL